MRLYFAHPFRHRVKNRAIELDIEASTDVEIFNPFYDDESRKSDTQMLDAKHVYDRMSHIDMDSITSEECKTYIDNVIHKLNMCDGVLAAPDGGGHTVPFVTMLAHSLSKDVYVVSEKFRDCPWFRTYSSCVFHNWDAFKVFFGLLR